MRLPTTSSPSPSPTAARSSSRRARRPATEGDPGVRPGQRVASACPGSVEPDALAAELRLDPRDVEPLERLVLAERDSGRDAGALAADRAAHHVPGRRVG